jgi:hypothetical protein
LSSSLVIWFAFRRGRGNAIGKASNELALRRVLVRWNGLSRWPADHPVVQQLVRSGVIECARWIGRRGARTKHFTVSRWSFPCVHWSSRLHPCWQQIWIGKQSCSERSSYAAAKSTSPRGAWRRTGEKRRPRRYFARFVQSLPATQVCPVSLDSSRLSS